jgi:hypothetical protein
MAMVSPKKITAPVHPIAIVPWPATPPPLRDGHEIAPPDFVGIGAMRSGTTWWWSVLKRHPGIFSGASPDGASEDIWSFVGQDNAESYVNKEFHFFDHYGRVEPIDPATYHRYFPRPPGLLAGEWTARYMHDFWTPPMLRRVAPGAKVLVLLRDPVERFVSGVALIKSFGFTLDSAVYNDQFSRGLYWQQLANVFSYFPRDQVLVLQYEQCEQDFTEQAHRTFKFLGLNPSLWLPPREPKSPVGAVTSKTDAIDTATRNALTQAYQADLHQLFRELPALDRRLWPCANPL